MKRGNKHRKPKVDHIVLRVGGKVNALSNDGKQQAIVTLMDGRLVTKHLLCDNGRWLMTYGARQLQRGKEKLSVLFFSEVTDSDEAFKLLQEEYLEHNNGPDSQINAFVEAWTEGNDEVCHDIIG